MRIRELDLKGFGKWRDAHFRFSDGINLFTARNEAGKSTLLEAIFAILFGMKRDYVKKGIRREEWERYRPWHGSPYGGSIVYQLEDRLYRIDRDLESDDHRLYDAVNFRELTKEFLLDIRKERPFLHKQIGLTRSLFEEITRIGVIGIENSQPMMEWLHQLQGSDRGSSYREVFALIEKKKREIGKGEMGKDTKMVHALRKVKEAKEELEKAKADLYHLRALEQEINQLEVKREQICVQLEEHDALREQRNQFERVNEMIRNKKELLSWIVEWKEQMDQKHKNEQIIALLKAELPVVPEKTWYSSPSDPEWHRFYTLYRDWLREEEWLESHVLDSSHERELLQYKALRELSPLISEKHREELEVQQKLISAKSRLQELKKKNDEERLHREIERRSYLDKLERQIQTREKLMLLFWLLGGLSAVAGITSFPFIPWLYGMMLVMIGLLFGLSSFAFSTKKLKKEMKQWVLEVKWEHEREYDETAQLIESLQKEIEQIAEEKHSLLSKLGLSSYDHFLQEREEWYARGQSITNLSTRIEEHRKNRDQLEEEIRDQLVKWNAPISREEWKEEIPFAYDQRLIDLEKMKQAKEIEAKIERLHEKQRDLELQLNRLEDRVWDKWKITPNVELLEEIEREIHDQKNVLQSLSLPVDHMQTDLENSFDELVEERQRIEQEIAQRKGEMSAYAHLSLEEKENQYALACSELEELERKRRILDLAEELFEETLEEWNRDISPELNQKTSEIFSHITTGRYQQVKTDPAENFRLRVLETATKEIRDGAILSKGTEQQLYLSFRLALVDRYSAQIPLPIFFDDSFTHYDPERLQKALAYIGEISKVHQVFLFSCQDREQEMLDRMGIDYHLVEFHEGNRAEYV